MRILITGADGFVGSHLCDSLLSENHEIIAISEILKNYPIKSIIQKESN